MNPHHFHQTTNHVMTHLRPSLREEALLRQQQANNSNNSTPPTNVATNNNNFYTVPQQPSSVVTSSSSSSSSDHIRKQWRQHGTGLSQAVEERRAKLLLQSNNSNNKMVPQITQAQDRLDPAGDVFTVYCILVQKKSGEKWMIEKRYSEFRRLYDTLSANKIKLPTAFPSKLTGIPFVFSFL